MLISLLFSILAIAVHFVWISGAMKRIAGISSLHMMSVSHLIAALLLFWFAYDDIPLLLESLPLIGNILGLGLCMFVARLLYYYAFSKADVSEVSIFSSLTPTYTLLVAPLFGHSISLMESIGVVLISSAVYFFFLPSPKGSGFSLHYFTRPFARITSSRPLLYTFISTFPPVLATIFQKQALDLSSPMLVSFAMALVIGMFGLMTMAAKKNYKEDTPSQASNGRGKILLVVCVAGVLQAVMIVSTSYLLTHTHPASMQALLRFAIPLQMILAYVLLKERKQLRHRLTSGMLAVIGGYIIMHANI